MFTIKEAAQQKSSDVELSLFKNTISGAIELIADFKGRNSSQRSTILLIDKAGQFYLRKHVSPELGFALGYDNCLLIKVV